MPIDTRLIPALEQELIFAKQVYPGGQPPNESRIAAIEAQLAIYRAAAAEQGEVVETTAAPEPYASENYESEPRHDPRDDDDFVEEVDDEDEDEDEEFDDEDDEFETADATDDLETA